MTAASDDRGLLSRFIARSAGHPLFAGRYEPPWRLTEAAAAIVLHHLASLGGGYRIDADVAVHATARIEAGATLKGPAIIGPLCFVGAGAYLRDGVFLEEDCVVGPGAELKSSFLFKGAKLAHLNFAGDSILGEGVNCEAGSVIANHRNEWADKLIRIAFDGRVIETGAVKFGALVGDGARIGANAVIAPGALIAPRTVVERLTLIDQSPKDASSA
jgi:NDP-sugar pyrophosphorylase family protein